METTKKMTKKVYMHGYMYTLVLAERRGPDIPTPCAFGYMGYALHSCRKVKKLEAKKV